MHVLLELPRANAGAHVQAAQRANNFTARHITHSEDTSAPVGVPMSEGVTTQREYTQLLQQNMWSVCKHTGNGEIRIRLLNTNTLTMHPGHTCSVRNAWKVGSVPAM